MPGRPPRAGDLLVRALGELRALWGDQLEVHLIGALGGQHLGWGTC
ncbi:peptidase C1A papain [Alicycliphilus sp. B1]|nr:peptidase C1A papain [Alicycliphilus sp. B1]